MNLAILLGVARYAKPVTDLPACTNDIALVRKLLQCTNRFGALLDLSVDTSSASVKTQLAQFIAKYKGQKIDEIFFYYSGHGDLYKDDFYFLLSDFSEDKRNQTSLTTEELDAMLRSLSPSIMVKVVDACHAGVMYVKESDALAKQLDKSKGRFTNCYFMFSSQASQPSFQDSRLSDFTETFIEACVRFQLGKDIRYRDIIDHISDSFANNTDQTPAFVIQAPCIEVFCTIDDAIQNLLKTDAEQKTGNNNEIQAAAPASTSVLESVKAQAKEFCTKQEADRFFADLKDSLQNGKLPGELAQMYGLEVEFQASYPAGLNTAAIGTWLKKSEGDFFAKITYRTEEYTETRDRDVFRIPIYQTKTVTRTRSVVSGFDSTAETPYKIVNIRATPAFENLPNARVTIVFVFSKKECVLFYTFEKVRESDWGKLGDAERQQWIYTRVKMKLDLAGSRAASNLLREFGEFLDKAVREKLGLLSEDADKPEKDQGD